MTKLFTNMKILSFILCGMMIFGVNITKASTMTKNEHYYNAFFCNSVNGLVEFRLENGTKVDCLTNEYAIEVDWAQKWYEGITQALYYAMLTNRKAKLLLILKDNTDLRFVKRADDLIEFYRLPVYIEIINK